MRTRRLVRSRARTEGSVMRQIQDRFSFVRGSYGLFGLVGTRRSPTNVQIKKLLATVYGR